MLVSGVVLLSWIVERIGRHDSALAHPMRNFDSRRRHLIRNVFAIGVSLLLMLPIICRADVVAAGE